MIDFPKGEKRAAFVDAYMISVSGTLTSQSGKTQEFPRSTDPFLRKPATLSSSMCPMWEETLFPSPLMIRLKMLN